MTDRTRPVEKPLSIRLSYDDADAIVAALENESRRLAHSPQEMRFWQEIADRVRSRAEQTFEENAPLWEAHHYAGGARPIAPADPDAPQPIRCGTCADPIGPRDRDGAWVDENGLESCAPFADAHEPCEHPHDRLVLLSRLLTERPVTTSDLDEDGEPYITVPDTGRPVWDDEETVGFVCERCGTRLTDYEVPPYDFA